LDTFKSFESLIYTVNDHSFDDIALRLFRFQSKHNAVYQSFIQYLGVETDKIHSLQSIPYLPISFFKNHSLKSGSWPTACTFTSSGTTGSTVSSHAIYDFQYYLNHAVKCFEYFFGDVADYHFLALLPSYLERSNSSLVAMMNYFIEKSDSPYSGFYLSSTSTLLADLEKLRKDQKKTILWGVTYALLDLAEKQKPDLSHCMIVETGGMKGKRNELTRAELHQALEKGLNVQAIYSEYGMTELLSQAYSKGRERFYCPPWQKIIGREVTDPFHKGLLNETGGINIIDLANWHSIAFIETEDIGKTFNDGSFEVLGRMDNSDIRGCNLLVE
jgi:phenylacetate-coenzyme A ligase PaaK-like adenylate-forming protein